MQLDWSAPVMLGVYMYTYVLQCVLNAISSCIRERSKTRWDINSQMYHHSPPSPYFLIKTMPDSSFMNMISRLLMHRHSTDIINYDSLVIELYPHC